MSAIHRALSDTGQRDSDTRSGFNPLQTHPPVRSQRAWWWLSLVLLVAIAMVAGQRFWSGTSPETIAEVQGQEIVTSQAATEEASQPENQTTAPEPSLPPEPIIERSVDESISETTTAVEDRSAVAVAQPVLAESEQPPAPQDQRAESLQPQSEVQPEPEPEPEPISRPEQPTRTSSAETAPARPSAIDAPEQSNRNIVTPSAPTYESRVQTAIADQDLPRAKQWLQQWISEEPTDDVPRVWLARIYLAEDRLAQAQGLLRGQSSIEARALMGLVHERTGEYQQAAALYETLAREDPGNGQWWLRWAINLENSGQLAQARNLYQTYLQVFPGQDGSLTRFAQQRYQSLEGQP